MAIVIVALALVLFLFVMNIVSLKREQHDVMQQQQQLEKQKEELQKALEDTDDTENIEEQARNQLRLIKPGETLYLFPEEMTEENNSNSSESEDQQ
ncbi:MAG TPA: septum formation initiator family protein [Candidatus Copromorpha excrementavium]|uniref:Septum formation initiator family protein n=1 Tax=Candidatus Allocopromorpha excrementavium TaxID=2840741 RepID=A0A9D1HBT1_9FIRM|nr:septum formation initiator family protein [Candidatus Copromorpha excrementavium]